MFQRIDLILFGESFLPFLLAKDRWDWVRRGTEEIIS